jgi:hypothetical protein
LPNKLSLIEKLQSHLRLRYLEHLLVNSQASVWHAE